MQFHEFRHEMKNPHFKRAMERISELEAENRRLREALDDIHMHGFEVGANVMVPKVEWDAAFARAALSQEDRDGT